MSRVALVPGCLALSSAYASIKDPLPDLRAAVERAVAWLGAEVEVVAAPHRRRLADELLGRRSRNAAAEPSVLVMLNGSASRSVKAPGYLDARAEEFDKALGEALITSDVGSLLRTDRALGEELYADLVALPELARLLEGAGPADVAYDAAPYGVQYWVLRWQL